MGAIRIWGFLYFGFGGAPAAPPSAAPPARARFGGRGRGAGIEGEGEGMDGLI